MKVKMLLTIGVIICSTLFCNTAMTVSPIPSDVQMVAPDPSLPKELKDFWGKWKGGAFMDVGYDEVFIIVEKIDEKKASLYFWSTKTKKWERKDADAIKDGSEYKLEFLGGSSGTRKELSLRKGKMILFSLASGVPTATLKRVP